MIKINGRFSTRMIAIPLAATALLASGGTAASASTHPTIYTKARAAKDYLAIVAPYNRAVMTYDNHDPAHVYGAALVALVKPLDAAQALAGKRMLALATHLEGKSRTDLLGLGHGNLKEAHDTSVNPVERPQLDHDDVVNRHFAIAIRHNLGLPGPQS